MYRLLRREQGVRVSPRRVMVDRGQVKEGVPERKVVGRGAVGALSVDGRCSQVPRLGRRRRHGQGNLVRTRLVYMGYARSLQSLFFIIYYSHNLISSSWA
jgi:hypothetical protein